jgi:uncharacterized protein YlxW (UPF0749 family)
MSELLTQMRALEQEVKTLEGRQTKRDPKRAAVIAKENAELQAKLTGLQTQILQVIQKIASGGTAEDAAIAENVFRKAAMEYCKITNKPADEWKSLESW